MQFAVGVIHTKGHLKCSNRDILFCLFVLINWIVICCVVFISNPNSENIIGETLIGENSAFIPHEFRWIDIKKNEYSKYYNEYELKSMNQSNPECEIIPHLDRRCCIGGILSNRGWNPKGYAKKNIFKRFDFSPLSEDQIYSMVDIAVKLDNNSIIVSVGDSITGQVADMMECNLYNHGFDEIHTFKNKESAGFPAIETNDPNYLRSERKYCNKASEKCVIMRSIASWTQFVELNNFCDWGDVYLINWSLHYSLDEGFKRTLNVVFDNIKSCDKAKNQVFVWRERSAQHFFSFGGYYDYHGKFGVVLNDSIWSEWYEQFTKDGKCEKGIKMYHQSTEEQVCLLKNQSEYLNVVAGINMDKFGCWPISYAGDVDKKKKKRNFVMEVANSSGIRTQIVYHDSKPKINKSDDSVNLFFIPFKDVTHPLWDHHADECTHYTTTPQWAEYIFHTLYLAISAVGNVFVV